MDPDFKGSTYHLKFVPFKIRTSYFHLNTALVWFSDPNSKFCFLYGGDPKSDPSKTGNIQKQDMLKVGNQMVRYLKGRAEYGYSFSQTIREPNFGVT